MKIPFAKPIINNSEIKLVNAVLKSPILTHGKRAEEFENAFSKFTKNKFCTTTSSCTAALHLSYMAMQLKKNDEVIVPVQTHVATVHTVEIFGAKPIFIDADINGNIDISKIEKRISNKTRCITIVHFLGFPVDMKKICKIAKKYKLFVVEDCALALGSKIEGKHVGSFGDFSCFSFYPAKHITTADGGMLVCKNKNNLFLVKRLKGFGVDKTFSERKVPGEYDVKHLGLNYRMNELQAALGIAQMKKIKIFLKKREANFYLLKNLIQKIKYIKVIETGNFKNFKSSFYALAIKLEGKLKNKRYEIIEELKNKGIGTSIYYPKIITDLQYYKKKYSIKNENFKNAMKISYNSITLPVGPHIKSKDIKFMYNNIKKIVESIY